MKKLLTIICALSLVMLFALPAMAGPHGGGLDVDTSLDETQTGVWNLAGAVANDGDAVDNSGLMIDDYDKDVTVNKSYSKTVNVDEDIDVDKSINDSFNYDKDVDIDKTVTVNKSKNKSIHLTESDAAIAYGGNATRMDDLELSFASTNSWSAVGQSNGISVGASPRFETQGPHGPQGGAGIEVEAENLDMCIDFTDNIGLGAGTFTQGNFNNANAQNNVTMSVQW
jgi:hypothetical protein